jgi:hypothetical protein
MFSLRPFKAVTLLSSLLLLSSPVNGQGNSGSSVTSAKAAESTSSREPITRTVQVAKVGSLIYSDSISLHLYCSDHPSIGRAHFRSRYHSGRSRRLRRIPLLPQQPQCRARRVRIPMHTLRSDRVRQGRGLFGLSSRRRRHSRSAHLAGQDQ